MCLLKDFITVFDLNTPIKVITENIVLYGRCYNGTDRDNSFYVFSINELLNKYGEYTVDYACILNGILHIEIDKRS